MTFDHRHLAMLAFEQQWWKHPGAKEGAIRDRFDVSPTLYYAELNRLIDMPEAMEVDPMTVGRLRRLRDMRRAARAGNVHVYT